MSKLYVGNLSWNTTDDVLRRAFAAFGTVTDSVHMKDPETQRCRGFGYVTFESPAEAQAAVDAMNEQELDGRRIRVNIALVRRSWLREWWCWVVNHSTPPCLIDLIPLYNSFPCVVTTISAKYFFSCVRVSYQVVRPYHHVPRLCCPVSSQSLPEVDDVVH
ncbi:hypothetical protein C8F01DRAFT_1256435 [Mycena amicta]|nr:hypothetical protein C8F01DRAFT_1256435 [Mycena amicta]